MQTLCLKNVDRYMSGVAKAAFKLRAELCERGFALVLDRGGMRRTWLRGRSNVHKRDLLHVAGYNLGLIMRLLTGHGTPREAAAARRAAVGIVLITDDAIILVVAVRVDDADEGAAFVVLVSLDG